MRGSVVTVKQKGLRMTEVPLVTAATCHKKIVIMFSANTGIRPVLLYIYTTGENKPFENKLF